MRSNLFQYIKHKLLGHSRKKDLKKQRKFFIEASHDLRTPLAIITTESEVVLKNTNNEKDLRRVVESNLEEVKKMSKLVNDLLLILKGEENIKDKLVPVDLYDFVNKIISKMKLQAKSKGLGMIVGEYKKIIAHVDVHNFERAVSNILQNAIYYTNVGNIRIYVMENMGKAHILVSDTGVGISEQDLPFVYERFFKGENSNGVFGGYGLGLSIAKQIIEQHGGSISIDSKIDIGTIIIVTIPKN